MVEKGEGSERSERALFNQEGASAVAEVVAWQAEVVSDSATLAEALFFLRMMMRGEESETISELSSVGLEATTRALP